MKETALGDESILVMTPADIQIAVEHWLNEKVFKNPVEVQSFVFKGGSSPMSPDEYEIRFVEVDEDLEDEG
jgi:hypothetical protein